MIISKESAPHLSHVKDTDNGFVRVGVSASSKLGCAVIRNRVKRQTRAICDSLIDYNKRSLDIVIIIKSYFLLKTFDDNKSQFCDFIKQVGL